MITVTVTDGVEEFAFMTPGVDQLKNALYARISPTHFAHGVILDGKLLPTVEEAIKQLKRTYPSSVSLATPATEVLVRGGTGIRHKRMVTVVIPWHDLPVKGDLSGLRFVCRLTDQYRLREAYSLTTYSTCGINLEELSEQLHRLRDEKDWKTMLVVDYHGRRPAYRLSERQQLFGEPFKDTVNHLYDYVFWLLLTVIVGGAVIVIAKKNEHLWRPRRRR